MKDTKIQWCDDTVNFWSGCTKVSEGCANCYAETQAQRFGTFGKWGPGGKRKLHESAFKLAHRLNRKPWVCDCGKAFNEPDVLHSPLLAPGMIGSNECCGSFHPRRIFSLSLGDWLDPEVPVEWLARMLATIRDCRNVQWLLLTKRPELWLERMTLAIGSDLHREAHGKEFNDWMSAWTRGNAPSHVWVGTSVENQRRAEERIPHLLRIPAAKHFLSCEPLLGPVDLGRVRWRTNNDHHGIPQPDHFENVLIGGGPANVPKVDWVIVGGESGPKARPCNVEWVRSLVAQCKAANVPCFVKQLGGHIIDQQSHSPYPIPDEWCWPVERGVRGDEATSRIWCKHKKGGDMSEWPEDLRVREFPQ